RDPVPEVARERGPQVGELAVGVAVRAEHRAGERLDDVAGHRLRDRVGVLVDVEGVPHRLLRRAVRRLPAEVGADGQIGERRHRRDSTGAGQPVYFAGTASSWPGCTTAESSWLRSTISAMTSRGSAAGATCAATSHSD